ncbi:CheR family methyltransferase [Muricomes intestini]|jgi:chemotaxis protein methyltransferase CheR|uniref:protein-glutamate O-methyltransferase n=1 Tax=Muricomes intestini TaxID=1796634 RepID=A0A4R3KIA2_9FIRM|nr:protein-glutamate O-methyltransferase CheR [Muricomes intestini]TCS82815.1 chemotaxis protein methyltransferase CheR [Muricomes intestini]HAX52794.1 chemotaxis protein CheR [Lachnospiraceae bacterium]HCR84251.1 chemotaxis protein CheR [Lachnospiraceae bacterium]
MITIEEQEFKDFANYIRANYGIHFKAEKKTLIEGRLGNLITSMHMGSLEEYMDYVKTDKSGKAASVMLDKITTNYTFFMRESEHFNYFRTTVLPFLANNVGDRDLRIWSAACSTGEEPYTLAMLIDEYLGPDKNRWDTKILATDISKAVISAAKSGIYENEKITELPLSWQKKYFKAYDSHQSEVIEKIKKEVIFGNINLMDTVLPFKRKMHVIFCRNVMIYFDGPTKERLIQRLYDITEPGGFLFIGHSEGLNRETTRYRYIRPAIYRKE